MTLLIDEIKQTAELYSKERTLTFLHQLTPSGRKTFHNGFILEVKTDILVFFDVVSKRSFPVLLDKITELDISRISLEYKTAWEICQQHEPQEEATKEDEDVEGEKPKQ